MVHLLGVPRVEGPDSELRLTGQPLAALAYLAVQREASVDEFISAIWGDDREVKKERVRDLLSDLRKAVGVDDVIARISSDGVIRAGSQLGCDLDVFCATVERATAEPSESASRLSEAVELVEGRPFNYQRSVAQYWRWADLAQLQAIWEHRVATAAFELGRLHLYRNDPEAALDAAHRGLRADGLNAALTEVLIEAFSASGAGETAQRVFEVHDRALADAGFGGASEETRRVFESILAAHQATSDSSTAV